MMQQWKWYSAQDHSHRRKGSSGRPTMCPLLLITRPNITTLNGYIKKLPACEIEASCRTRKIATGLRVDLKELPRMKAD